MKGTKGERWRKLLVVIAFLGALAFSSRARAEEQATLKLDKSLENLKFGILAYLEYSAGASPLAHNDEENFNKFALTRGYFTLQKEITPWLKARMTADAYQREDGYYDVMLKYYYAQVKFPDLGPLTNLSSEIGMGHMPWLDFEEHINPYRCQGTMAIERAGIFNSADLGVSLMGYFGGKLEDAKKRTGNDYYAGKFGSWHIGVYNGPGYHAVEANQNKVVEGRITLRPLPSIVPGLQLSYFGLYGEGNTRATATDEFPDYVVHLGMLSFEHPRFIFTGQYFTTEGIASGKLIDGDGEALTTQGYSFFGNVKLPIFGDRPNIFARYDYFDADIDDKVAEDSAYQMYIGGIAIDLYKGNMLLFVYENTDYEDDSGGKKGKTPKVGNELGDDWKFQVVFQVKF